MAALEQVYHGIQMHEIQKREKNWAAREPGVVLVFCIVFIGTLTLLPCPISFAAG